MGKVYYCDFLYTEHGHFDGMFNVLNKYCDNELEYYKDNIFNHKGFSRIAIFKPILKLSDPIIIASASYIYLLLASIIYHNFNYKLIVHFVPKTSDFIYKLVFKILCNKVNSLIFLSPAVRNDMNSLIDISKYEEKCDIIHIKNINRQTKKCNKEMVISVIGPVNEAKDYKKILDAINYGFYENIVFNFKCYGINEFLKNVNFINRKNNNITFDDRFLDIEEYDLAFKESDYVIISYAENYGVRYSAILFDALKNGTPVIVNNNEGLRYYIEKYNCGFIFDDCNGLHNILDILNKKEKEKLVFADTLFEDFSEENNKKLVEKAFLNR